MRHLSVTAELVVLADPSRNPHIEILAKIPPSKSTVEAGARKRLLVT